MTKTLFLRYEDLVKDLGPQVTNIFKFVLDTDSLEGTLVEKRIKEIVESNEAARKVKTYSLKPTTGQECARIGLYSDEQLEFIREKLESHLRFF